MSNLRRCKAVRTTRSHFRWWCFHGLLAAGLICSVQAVEESSAQDAPARTKSKSLADSKASATADAGDAMDDDALETDDDFSDLVVPADLLAKARTMDRLKFVQELRGVLTEGMPDRGDGSAAAKRHFESARRLVADDPRGPYAYGLALMMNKKMKDALEQYRDAARQSKAPFLPALHAAKRRQEASPSNSDDDAVPE